MRISKYLLIAVPLVLNVSGANGASLQIVYNTPQGGDEANARVFLEEEGVTQTVTALLNDEFELRSNLLLFMGGSEGPRFDRTDNEIHMPYSFVFEVAERFEQDSYSQTNVDIYDVTRDAYLHALLHHVSHALFDMFDLRAAGNMEKAVDALTVLLLIRYYENGGDIALNAAELFVDEDGSSGGSAQPDFWTEHGFDQQSYNQAICLVYGSDPQRYSDLKDRSQFLQIRDQECVREYQRQINAWFRVLESFLKRPPPG